MFPGDGPAPLPVPVQARVVAAPQLYVQFGAFAQRGNAEVLRGRLRQDAFTPTRVTAAADRLFRVRVGPLDSVEQADLLITRAQQQGYEPTLIIE